MGYSGKMGVAAALLVTCGTLTIRAEDKRIAVVNVSSVFQSYAKVKDVQEKLKKEYDPAQKELADEEQKLKRKEEQIKMDMATATDELDGKIFKERQGLEGMTFDYKIKVKKLYMDVEDRRKNEMKAVLNEIKTAIRLIGTSEKYDLVLRAPEFADEFDPNKAKNPGEQQEEEPKTAAELVRRFRENPVLYFSSGVDITTKVIDMLNAEYRANPGKK